VDYLGIKVADFETFLLIFFRVMAILLIAPIFGSRSVPKATRIGLGALLALILFPVVSHPVDVPGDVPSLTLWGIRELILGMTFGFATTVLFMGVQMAGTILGIKIGFGMVNIIDPTTGANVSILGQFLYFIAILIFLALDGHHFLIQALAESYSVVPIGKATLSSLTLEKMVRMTSGIFAVGIKIGAPTVAVIICINFAMGVLARMTPQINILIVGFPLYIFVGILSIMLSFPLFAYVFTKLLEGMKEDLLYILYSL